MPSEKKLNETLRNHENRIRQLEKAIKKLHGVNFKPESKSIHDKKKSKKSSYGKKVDEILKLKASGFFKTPQVPQKIKEDLKRRGKKRYCRGIEVTLLRLVDRGELNRKEVRDSDGKKIWAYYS